MPREGEVCPRGTAANGREHGVLESVSNFSKSDRGELGCKFPTNRSAYLQIPCSFLSGTRLSNVSHVPEGLRESSVKPLRGAACFVKREQASIGQQTMDSTHHSLLTS